MNTLISAIIQVISSSLVKIILSTLSCVKEVFSYLNGKRNDKKEEQRKNDELEFQKKAEDVVKNGTIDDLPDLRR